MIPRGGSRASLQKRCAEVCWCSSLQAPSSTLSTARCYGTSCVLQRHCGGPNETNSISLPHPWLSQPTPASSITRRRHRVPEAITASTTFQNSQYAYADLLCRSLPQAAAWLDLGCGHESLPSWLHASRRQLNVGHCLAVGIDQDRAALRRHCGLSLRVSGDIETLPFRDNSFDLVTANTVLEHVRDPRRLFGEIARVLAPG